MCVCLFVFLGGDSGTAAANAAHASDAGAKVSAAAGAADSGVSAPSDHGPAGDFNLT